ncbi:GAF and ANTAR domain-containing protein [Nakamurella flavida]|uniref:GAF and ANTAR domain-containing protein n=1 Tax=Nakamurella flavida TaxID=363630 RepID=A0A938YNE1_9ACTN|nr:GAF and ANTAR domain-containing protein [Nakamurella flavida]MBM9478479.1 GAF and ANTAR domain-containing protein [Nakamurella flavida]MDP9777695.1 GAF domain-containing protein [Nakamurella flavida]
MTTPQDSDHPSPGPADDADLSASLAGLAGLSSLGSTLETVLTRIAEYAVQAIPGADGAGLTLLEPDRADLIVKSAPFVVEVDDIQYDLGEGPCVDAAAQGRTMRSGSLGGDPRWPRFGPRVGRLGVHSVLSLPLITPTGVVGAMNVYAHAKHAFDENAERVGEIFAVPAAVSVQNAHILAQAQRLAQHLEIALAHRAAIDQAIGILRARSGLTADEAFDRLRQLSQHQHRKLAEVAATIVQEAVNRARHQHRPPPAPSS